MEAPFLSKRKKRDNPGPGYVRVEDCHERHERIELALFGKDGRGGMAKDITIIKSKLSLVRQFLLPLAIAVFSAVLTAWILGKF